MKLCSVLKLNSIGHIRMSPTIPTCRLQNNISILDNKNNKYKNIICTCSLLTFFSLFIACHETLIILCVTYLHKIDKIDNDWRFYSQFFEAMNAIDESYNYLCIMMTSWYLPLSLRFLRNQFLIKIFMIYTKFS